jgi:uncharacterized membrane protein
MMDETRPMYREDTKLIDLLAALAAGLMLQYRAWVRASFLLVDSGLFTADSLKNAFLYAAAFALAASLVCLWKSRLRRKVGWVLIAVLGAGFCSGIQEYFVAKAFAQEPMALFEGYELTVFNFLSNCYTTLPVMGAVHYGGTLLREVGSGRHSRHR